MVACRPPRRLGRRALRTLTGGPARWGGGGGGRGGARWRGRTGLLRSSLFAPRSALRHGVVGSVVHPGHERVFLGARLNRVFVEQLVEGQRGGVPRLVPRGTEEPAGRLTLRRRDDQG